jgi:hypothetical protein
VVFYFNNTVRFQFLAGHQLLVLAKAGIVIYVLNGTKKPTARL